MTPFVGTENAAGLSSEAAALALMAVQHLATATMLARRLEVAAQGACDQVGVKEASIDPRVARGEIASVPLTACVEALFQARDLRAELEHSLLGVLPWCGSVQVREAMAGRINHGGPFQ